MLTTYLSSEGECSKRFAGIKAPCLVEDSNRTEYGADPAFHYASDLYKEDVDIADYYNVSDPHQISDQGVPYAFHRHEGTGGFHVFLDSGVSGQRARDVLQWLEDANYLSEHVTTLTLETMLLNLDLDLLLALRVTMTRGDNDGLFYPEVDTSVIKASSMSRSGTLYALAVVWIIAHLYQFWADLRPIFVTVLVYGPNTGFEIL